MELLEKIDAAAWLVAGIIVVNVVSLFLSLTAYFEAMSMRARLSHRALMPAEIGTSPAQAREGRLDTSNPPRGGSGVPKPAPAVKCCCLRKEPAS